MSDLLTAWFAVLPPPVYVGLLIVSAVALTIVTAAAIHRCRFQLAHRLLGATVLNTVLLVAAAWQTVK